MIELATPEEQDPRKDQPITTCQADHDGDCTHPQCPQLKDYKISCPLRKEIEEY